MQSEFAKYKAENKIGARDFGRLVQALALAKGHLGNAVLISRQRDMPGRIVAALEGMLTSRETLDDLVLKGAVAAGTGTDSSWAGPLAPVFDLGSEFVSYMRPLTILGRIPVRPVPFQVRFARITSGASNVGFVGQGVATPVHALSFDTLTLGYAKVNAISVLTEELVRSQSYSAPGLIAADLAAATASFLDETLIDPDRIAVAGVSPASITAAATQIQSTGLTPAEITADCKSAMKVLDAARVPLSQCCWIITQDVALYLATLLSTTGAPVFEGFSLAEGGTLFGLPAYVSGSAFGANSPSEGLIILVHPQSVAVADDNVAIVSITQNAAIQLDPAPTSSATTLTSLWSQNAVGAKVTRYCNWLVRRDGAVAVIRGINL